MISFTDTLDLPIAVDEVFERLADMAELDRWNPNVTESRRLSGQRLAVGSHYLSTIQRGPIRMKARSELVAIEPGRSVTYEGWISGFWSIDSLSFELHGAGTRVTFENQTRLPSWLRFLAPLLEAAFRPQARRAVEGARAYLADPPRSQR